MKKTIFLAVAVICAAFLLASCTATDSNSNSNANNGNASKGNDNKTGGTTASGGEIGIAECDAFLKKYEACLNEKVPEAQRSAFKPGLDAWKKSWKDLAAKPETRASLANACTQAETSAKQSMTSFGCSW